MNIPSAGPRGAAVVVDFKGVQHHVVLDEAQVRILHLLLSRSVVANFGNTGRVAIIDARKWPGLNTLASVLEELKVDMAVQVNAVEAVSEVP